MMQNNDIDIWHIPLCTEQEHLPKLIEVLDIEEKAKAGRYKFRKDHDAFITSHAAMRIILSKYLRIPAKSLIFKFNDYNKPELTSEKSNVRFNLSHSHQHAILAVADGIEIGADIEFQKDIPPDERLEIGKHYFSDSEYEQLQSLERELINKAFLACWTRKEAYIKMHGLGLSLPLKEFSVTIDPKAEPELLSSEWRPQDLAECTLANILVPLHYQAALAAKTDKHLTIRYFNWSPGSW